MLTSHLRQSLSRLKVGPVLYKNRRYSVKPLVASKTPDVEKEESASTERVLVGVQTAKDIFSKKVVPVALVKREDVVLPFDEVPGPSSLKLLAKARYYLSTFGTQLTAGLLTFGINVGSYFNQKGRMLSSLFDEYGPVVRFVSPMGGDIVLLNNPSHIQQVFIMEGDTPVRSILDSLEKYRMEKRSSFSGLYNTKGELWRMHRSLVTEPLNNAVTKHLDGLDDTCNNLVIKIYNSRNYHDEINRNLYKEIHKWAFDCMGLLIFSKKFSMLETEVIYNQCDMSWLYHCLDKCSSALLKCESGMQMWKLMPTWSWKNLVKYCDSVDNLIGKYVTEAEQKLATQTNKPGQSKDECLITSLLASKDKMTTEDISTILMDMLLIGINTISSSMTFLLYNLAKHQKVQKILHEEIRRVCTDPNEIDSQSFSEMPYLQACIKENLRLVPPIPVLTRVLEKNVMLDKYNIPRGTLIIMSTLEASLKECNYDDATRFRPERWHKPEASDYHAFASIPFGFGARKCLGQNIAETMMLMMTCKILNKFKLEYHYGDIHPTNTFIVKPNKSPKIRFIDRM